MSRKRRKEKLPLTFLCPCCDHMTLSVFGGGEVCAVCFWEDDGITLTSFDVSSASNNGLTLTQARASFEMFGACDEQYKTKVCGSDERRTYICVSRKKEFLVIRLLSALHELGIASAETGNCPCCQLDDGLSEYAKAKDKRGFLLYRFEGTQEAPFNSFINGLLWFVYKSNESEDLLEFVRNIADEIGLQIQVGSPIHIVAPCAWDSLDVSVKTSR